MSDGYYDGPGPAYGGVAGPPPGAMAHMLLVAVAFLLIILAAALAYRQGTVAQRRRDEADRAKTAGVIYQAIQARINGALLAPGEQIFAPAKTLMDTIELYLGPVLVMMGGFGSSVGLLRKALTTTTKEVEDSHHGAPAPLTGIVVATPAGSPGAAVASAGGGAAAASASNETGGLHVFKLPVADHGHGSGHGGGHGDHGHGKKKVEMSIKEQARAVRDALETLAEHWKEDRIKSQIKGAQAALLVFKPIGTVSERATERAQAAARLGGPRSEGSLLRPSPRPGR